MKTAIDVLVEDLPIRVKNAHREDIDRARKLFEDQVKAAWNDAYEKGTRDRLEKIANPVGDENTYWNETFKTE